MTKLHSKSTICVTGAAGFIGSNFVRYLLNNTEYSVISFDALTYAGNLENLAGLDEKRHQFVKGNICDKDAILDLLIPVDAIVHFAAESHVDRSIMNSEPFIQTNVVGTQRLMDAVRQYGIQRFIHVSTDEVYGSLKEMDAPFTEQHMIQPNSPYSASKAASDLLVRSYVETFGFPAVITRCSNNYGPYQFPEKLVPLMINNARQKKRLPVYGQGLNVRDWIYVEDHCSAVLAVLNQGKIGEVYNIGGEYEIKNIDIVKKIIQCCGVDESLIQFVKDRPGHDFRYAMDISKIEKELNWRPKVSFDDGLDLTLKWYTDNMDWLDHITSGEYISYYQEQYQ